MSKFYFFTVLLFAVLIAIPAIAQQANTTGVASLTVAGVGGGAVPPPGPFVIQQALGATTNTSFVFSGAANMPFALINANPSLGGITLFGGGIPVPPFGILDVGPLGFPPIEFVLDGFASAGTLLGALLNTGTTGSKTFTFTLVNGAACPFVIGNVQAAVATVGPPGLLLTAAFAIGAVPVPADAFPVAVTPAAGDDTTHPYSFATCGTFPFYGIARSGYNINSNGNITFGGGLTTFGETQAGFTAGLAKICAAWDDFNFVIPPSLAGAALTKFDTGAAVTASWTGVAEFGMAGTLNTFTCTMVMATGDIMCTYGAMSSTDSITGITPGPTALPITIFGPAAPPLVLRISDHLAGGALGAYVGAAGESMNELYTTVGTATTLPFNLALGPVLTWMSTGPGSYTMF